MRHRTEAHKAADGPAGKGGRPHGLPLPALKKGGAGRGYAHFALRARTHRQAPGSVGGLRKPRKGILPVSLSGGAEYAVPCIICHASRKQNSSRCVLQLFGIEYHPASLEAGS